MIGADDLRAAITYVEGAKLTEEHVAELKPALEETLARDVPELDWAVIRDLRPPDSIRIVRAEVLESQRVSVGVVLDLVVSSGGLFPETDESTREDWASRVARDPINEIVDNCDETDAQWKSAVHYHNRATIHAEMIVDVSFTPRVERFEVRSVNWARSTEHTHIPA